MPRKPDLQASARALTADAVRTLAEIMRSGSSEHARIAAAQALLERGHGKAGQRVKLSGDEDGVPIEQVIRWAKTVTEATPDPSGEDGGGPRS